MEVLYVIDEKWLYARPLPPLQGIRAWVDVGGDRPEVPRRIISDIKYHIIVAINFLGANYSEVVEPNETVNSQRYVLFLQNLMRVRRSGQPAINNA